MPERFDLLRMFAPRRRGTSRAECSLLHSARRPWREAGFLIRSLGMAGGVARTRLVGLEGRLRESWVKPCQMKAFRRFRMLDLEVLAARGRSCLCRVRQRTLVDGIAGFLGFRELARVASFRKGARCCGGTRVVGCWREMISGEKWTLRVLEHCQ